MGGRPHRAVRVKVLGAMTVLGIWMTPLGDRIERLSGSAQANVTGNVDDQFP
jgi:membrane protein YqaA with SNARE-associated domain